MNIEKLVSSYKNMIELVNNHISKAISNNKTSCDIVFFITRTKDFINIKRIFEYLDYKVELLDPDVCENLPVNFRVSW